VLGIVQRILEVTERTDLVPDVRDEVTHEIRAQFLDSAKARRVLGWRPRFTLDQGLRLTHAWYRGLLAEVSA
jgi:CDP-glucose 4,6-dehydratase